MAIVTVAAQEEVKSRHHNEIAGLLNGTAGFGNPVYLTKFDSTSTYALNVNQVDATNGLIAEFKYNDIVVAQIKKGGIAAIMRDTGGLEFNLMAYANGATINDGVTDTDAAWTLAFAAVQAAGGGKVAVPSGTFLAPTAAVTYPSNLVIEGRGQGATIIKHRATSNQEPIKFFGKSGCMVKDLTVDGNRTNNNHPTTGFQSSEISLDGTRNWAVNCKVTNFNHTGITVGGVDCAAVDCWIDGPAIAYASYTAWPTTDIGGIYGITAAQNIYTQNAMVLNCKVTGTRNNGIAVGGIGTRIIGNYVADCHRTNTSTGSGGGQISFQATKISVDGDTGPRHCIIANNTVLDTTTAGNVTIGIEVSTDNSVTNDGFMAVVTGNTVQGQNSIGITINDSSYVICSKNTVRGCGNSSGSSYGIAVAAGAASSFIQIEGNIITDTVGHATNYGLYISNLGHSYYSVVNNMFWNNGGSGGTVGQNHYLDSTTGSGNLTRHVWGNTAAPGAGPTNFVTGPTNVFNQGDSDDAILLMQSSDIAHGVTSIAPTSSYGYFGKFSATSGGLRIYGLADTGTFGVYTGGIAVTPDTTKSATAQAVVVIDAAIASGTTTTTVGANGNLLVVQDNGGGVANTRFLVDREGDIHMDATSNINAWDDYDDVQLLEAYRVKTASPVNYRRLFADNIDAHAQILHDTGVITMNEDGHHFVSFKGLTGLMIDSIRQVSARTDARIENIERQLLALGAGAE